jgi:hypothetical protein
VPHEICTPPLPLSRLEEADRIRQGLAHRGAEGTGRSMRYAFGLHINPEVPRLDAPALLKVLRAFILLEHWLRRSLLIDRSRKATPYIDPFGVAYARVVLDNGYRPDMTALIDDYLLHNPTRNRGLDMLAVMAHIDERRVRQGVSGIKLLKPRPTFHYRLPNCSVDEPGWTVAAEWNAWVAVERLAEDAPRLAAMSERYLALTATPLSGGQIGWNSEVEDWL